MLIRIYSYLILVLCLSHYVIIQKFMNFSPPPPSLVRITALGTVCILNCHSVPRSVVVTPLERVFLRTGTTARLTGNLSTQNQKNIAGRSARSYLDN